ncbi:hypothetical protein [Sulfuracidifex tepidarius]|uniref:hypothetical protein n=1 Tax=Sulfuracidifex tepidarius TaxID=1294262 RepID=UPI001E437BB0|nr:hypothetical protein [Sulfuracidifex tepidarius]
MDTISKGKYKMYVEFLLQRIKGEKRRGKTTFQTRENTGKWTRIHHEGDKHIN